MVGFKGRRMDMTTREDCRVDRRSHRRKRDRQADRRASTGPCPGDIGLIYRLLPEAGDAKPCLGRLIPPKIV